MQRFDGEFILSPSDVVNHLACEHLTQINRLVAIGELNRPDDGRPEVQLIRRLGDEHERRYLEQLRAHGSSIVEIPDASSVHDLPHRHNATVAAMQAGADVIFQATFFDGTWRGHADFLIRVSDSDPGNLRYEPFDTKLARTEKVSALVQLADYARHLEAIQGVRPARVHIVLGDNRVSTFETAQIAGYHRRARARLVEAITDTPDTYPEPVSHCGVCQWHARCDQQRRDDDHLVLVAGVGRTQIKSLRTAGIRTASELASAPQGAKPARMQDSTWDRIRRQAKLQKRTDGSAAFETIDPAAHPTGGLKLLPAPSHGDLFFDIEGDPYRGFESAGLEYLWGVSDADDNFRAFWAHDELEERAAFEDCVDYFIDAFGRDPAMHVYHYASYEISVLRRLASRFNSRIDEVDHLLRNEVLVDLYAVARHAIRISAERLSIKDLEAFYRDKRDTEVQSGMESVVQYEAWLDSHPDPACRDPQVLNDIEMYNRDDCISTRQLRDWLEERRTEAVAAGASISRPGNQHVAISPTLSARRQRIAPVRDALIADHDPSDPISHAGWLLGHLLEYHERESKPQWWKHFEQIAMSPEELWEDSEAVAGLTNHGIVGTVKRSVLFELCFDPEQPHKLKPGDGAMADHEPGPDGNYRSINIHEVDAVEGKILVKQGQSNDAPMPKNLVSPAPMSTTVLEDAILRVASSWQVSPGNARHRMITDLLLGNPPRTKSGQPLRRPGESALDAVVRVADDLDQSCLAVQGPPGTGKTFTGGRMIRRIVASGKTVGVVSNSHRAVENLLRSVIEAEGAPLRVLKVGDTDEQLPPAVDHEKSSSKAAQALLDGDYDVVGGTAWFFARPELGQVLDVLVVDEAGQFSLANTVAAATSAKNLVLLGDPQQLDQPVQGSHPDGVAVSALSHYIGADAKTIPPERGIFLDDTWRMDPAVCSFVSDCFYEGRLRTAALAPQRTIDGLSAGTYWVPTHHDHNRARSHEEAEVAAEIARSLVGRTFCEDGVSRPLRASDIMFIAPFNAQVGALRNQLDQVGLAQAEVGTVDLFQGRQAPVVIYSLTASSGELAPRGIDFLFSANRFNVAVSRAQVASIVIGNPALLDTNARTPEQVPLIGALCNYVDRSGRLEGVIAP